MEITALTRKKVERMRKVVGGKSGDLPVYETHCAYMFEELVRTV